MSPFPTRVDLDSDLARLEAAVPDICRNYPGELQLEAVATEGELIRESAAPEDDEYVSARVEAMLINAGLIEGEPLASWVVLRRSNVGTLRAGTGKNRPATIVGNRYSVLWISAA